MGRKMKPLAPGTAVVCLNLSREPTTWGTVVNSDCRSAQIKYGEGAPIWTSTTWVLEYLVQYESEAAARKVVEDFDNR
jgi:hypothetical protein